MTAKKMLKLALLAFALRVHAEAPPNQQLGGKVLQVIMGLDGKPNGLLVHQYGQGEMDYLVVGYPGTDQITDDEGLKMFIAKPTGVYHYADVTGANRSVKAFRFVSFTPQ